MNYSPYVPGTPMRVTMFGGKAVRITATAVVKDNIIPIRFGDYILYHPINSTLHVDIDLPVYRNAVTGAIVAQVRESSTPMTIPGEPDHILVIYPQLTGKSIKRFIRNMSIADACAQFIFI